MFFPLLTVLPPSMDEEAKPSEPIAKRGAHPVPWWLWAGVAALLVLTAYNVWASRRLHDQIRQTQTQATEEMVRNTELRAQIVQAARDAVIGKIVTDPASARIPMRADNKGTPELVAHWHSRLGIVVNGAKLQQVPKDRTLELWLIPRAKGGKPVPAGVLRPDPNGNFVMLVTPKAAMEDTRALAITEETKGGTKAPTTKPIWFGGLP